jgi:hypothetical protein
MFDPEAAGNAGKAVDGKTGGNARECSAAVNSVKESECSVTGRTRR